MRTYTKHLIEQNGKWLDRSLKLTLDAYKALQFQSKESAEKWLVSANVTGSFDVTDHMFIDDSPIKKYSDNEIYEMGIDRLDLTNPSPDAVPIIAKKLGLKWSDEHESWIE